MGISDYLRDQRVPFELLLHWQAPCASVRARNLRVTGQRVAKAVLIRSDDGYLLAVLPATHRIDLARLGDVLGLRALRLATEAETESVFHDCEPGALPPFGRLYGLTTVVDASLAGAAEILILGNLRHQSLRLHYRDFEAIEQPVRARFAVPAAPGATQPVTAPAQTGFSQ